MPSQKKRRRVICDRVRKIVAFPPIPKKSSTMSSGGKSRFTAPPTLTHSGQLDFRYVI